MSLSCFGGNRREGEAGDCSFLTSLRSHRTAKRPTIVLCSSIMGGGSSVPVVVAVLHIKTALPILLMDIQHFHIIIVRTDPSSSSKRDTSSVVTNEAQGI